MRAPCATWRRSARGFIPIIGAVWRSDIAAPALHFWRSSDDANAEGGTLIWKTDGPLVEAVSFDDMVDAISENGGRRIGLLKIDCEAPNSPSS